MLNEGRTYLKQAPWLMVYPGIAIIIVVICFNLLGDSIRDMLDPTQERTLERPSNQKIANENREEIYER
jgi:ABC-type dipeptide/oligopeptide/nickel transport system permease subunit